MLLVRSGPGNPFSATNGFPWVKAVTDLFVLGPNKTTSDGTFTPPPLLMSFTVRLSTFSFNRESTHTSTLQHDNNLPPIISALGLWNASSVSPLSLTHPNPYRHFRSSYLVAFRGYVALERLSCEAPLGDSVQHKAGQVVLTPGKGKNAKKYVRVRVCA
jgi:hypothetical protein